MYKKIISNKISIQNEFQNAALLGNKLSGLFKQENIKIAPISTIKNPIEFDNAKLRNNIQHIINSYSDVVGITLGMNCIGALNHIASPQIADNVKTNILLAINTHPLFKNKTVFFKKSANFILLVKTKEHPTSLAKTLNQILQNKKLYYIHHKGKDTTVSSLTKTPINKAITACITALPKGLPNSSKILAEDLLNETLSNRTIGAKAYTIKEKPTHSIIIENDLEPIEIDYLAKQQEALELKKAGNYVFKMLPTSYKKFLKTQKHISDANKKLLIKTNKTKWTKLNFETLNDNNQKQLIYTKDAIYKFIDDTPQKQSMLLCIDGAAILAQNYQGGFKYVDQANYIDPLNTMKTLIQNNPNLQQIEIKEIMPAVTGGDELAIAIKFKSDLSASQRKKAETILVELFNKTYEQIKEKRYTFELKEIQKTCGKDFETNAQFLFDKIISKAITQANLNINDVYAGKTQTGIMPDGSSIRFLYKNNTVTGIKMKNKYLTYYYNKFKIDFFSLKNSLNGKLFYTFLKQENIQDLPQWEHIKEKNNIAEIKLHTGRMTPLAYQLLESLNILSLKKGTSANAAIVPVVNNITTEQMFSYGDTSAQIAKANEKSIIKSSETQQLKSFESHKKIISGNDFNSAQNTFFLLQYYVNYWSSSRRHPNVPDQQRPVSVSSNRRDNKDRRDNITAPPKEKKIQIKRLTDALKPLYLYINQNNPKNINTLELKSLLQKAIKNIDIVKSQYSKHKNLSQEELKDDSHYQKLLTVKKVLYTFSHSFSSSTYLSLYN